MHCIIFGFHYIGFDFQKLDLVVFFKDSLINYCSKSSFPSMPSMQFPFLKWRQLLSEINIEIVDSETTCKNAENVNYIFS